ncbi:hypothetical protein AN958_09709 [Leucoagaricus sp. SymC.cos]|nr:hypothetical protein AN958_09709 [Leucoagaricus sp. SymC.cos]
MSADYALSRKSHIIFFRKLHVPNLKKYRWNSDLDPKDTRQWNASIGFLKRLPSILMILEAGSGPLHHLDQTQTEMVFSTIPQIGRPTLEPHWQSEHFNTQTIAALVPPPSLPQPHRNNFVPKIPYHLIALVKSRRDLVMDVPDLRIEVDTRGLRWAMEDMENEESRELMKDGFGLQVWEGGVLMRYTWPKP